MREGVLIGAVFVAALACPTMMWLGRRGIGPGCGMAKCPPEPKDESLESLKRRQNELDLQIAALDPDAPPSREEVLSAEPRRWQ